MSIQMLDGIKTTEDRTDDVQGGSRPLHDWLVAEKAVTAPAMFYGEFWLEDEMAVLCADAGLGKSILAMQIAESIARSKPVSPLPRTASKRKVLYVDMEMNTKQLTLRYAADAGGGQTLKKRYRFSSDLSFVRVDPERLLSGNSAEETAQMFGRIVEAEIEKSGARELIVDSLTALKTLILRIERTAAYSSHAKTAGQRSQSFDTRSRRCTVIQTC